MPTVVRWICRFLSIVAIVIAWLCAWPLLVHILIYLGKDNYHPETFLVTGAHVSISTRHVDSFWLNGVVAGHDEELCPEWHGDRLPRTAEEVLAVYPRGARIAVLYNAAATTAIIQDTSLRVLEATPDYWQQEALLRWGFAWTVSVSLVFAGALFYISRRRPDRRPNLFGMRAGRFGGRLIAHTVVADSPAYRAGIRDGDTLVSLDGKPAVDLDLQDVHDLIYGGQAQRLAVTYRHGEQERSVTLLLSTVAAGTVN